MKNSSELAQQIRLDVLNMTSKGGGSHIGSCYSVADIIAVLYSGVINISPETVDNPERDIFILSKGHAGAAIYSVLARKGFFPTEKLDLHYSDGSDLSGHVSHKGIPGVELSTGSLGHGLSVATGFALGAKLDGLNRRVITLMSDGECDEGSNWEPAMFAPHHKLDNLTAIIDYNKIQSLDSTHKTLNLEPFADKWKAFGWNVLEVDGHSHSALKEALSVECIKKDTPTCIIAHTTKGKGVSFMENSVLWHYRIPKGEEYEAALAELKESE
ncbi:MAG: transketolase [Bdellovibrionota bacterium]